MKNELLKKYKKAPITMGLMTVCIVVYIISFVLFGETMNVYEGIAFGAYNPLFIAYKHEYFRFFTANFIHFGLLHIAVNCYSLYGIGMFIESVLKEKKYAIVLFMSAIATTVLPYLMFLVNGFEANTISGGISGVIFGLIGALGALALKYRDVFMDIFKQLAPNVILMLVISFVVPSISWSGHVSGMIGGFIATYILLNIKVKPKKNDYSDLVN
ncbi:MAG: rhomboid family intramembrane serine protease [Longibaculum sp.]